MANGNYDAKKQSCEEISEIRLENLAYQYLCHLEEARLWIQSCIQEKLPTVTEFEERLRNGVYLAKLGNFLAPDFLPLKKVYDPEQDVYNQRGLNFRHTDNLNYWIQCMKIIGLPSYFYPDILDVYEKKKVTKVIYCIHALSIYLFKLGKTAQVQNLYGVLKFSFGELNSVCDEFERCNVNMPSFSKIGSILDSEFNERNDPSVNSVIAALNNAVDKHCLEKLLECLQNPKVHFSNVNCYAGDEYLNHMHKAKQDKDAVFTKKQTAYFSVDALSGFLSWDEIQRNINEVNTFLALKEIHEAVLQENSSALVKAMTLPQLGLHNFVPSNAGLYLKYLSNNKHSIQINSSTKGQMQQIITLVNNYVVNQKNEVDLINDIVANSDSESLYKALKYSSLKFMPLYEFAEKLYFEEFSVLSKEKGKLTFDIIQNGIKLVSAVVLINEMVKNGNRIETFKALSNPDACVCDLVCTASAQYQEMLSQALQTKSFINSKYCLISHSEIQKCVCEVNKKNLEETERQNAQQKINNAIYNNDCMKILHVLLNPAASIICVQPENAYLYLNKLIAKNNSKQEFQNVSLSLSEIQQEVNIANKEALEAKFTCMSIVSINISIQSDCKSLLDALNNPAIGINPIIEQCAANYKSRLHEAKERKRLKNLSTSNNENTAFLWVHSQTQSGHSYYFNLQTLENSWVKPPGYFDSSLLLKNEIETIVYEVNKDHYCSDSSFELKIIRLQAWCRGYLLRTTYVKKKNNFTCNHIFKTYSKRELLAVIHLQSYIRMWLSRKRYMQRKNFFQQHEEAVRRIQAFWRAHRTRNQFKILKNSPKPLLKTVQNCVDFLQITSEDYAEDLQLQSLRGDIVQTIRHNEELEKEVSKMDVKIALLIRNRISLQEVLRCKMNKKKDCKQILNNTWLGCGKGLKALSKESRARLELYQQLFYVLQSKPHYLAEILFIIPTSHLTKFVESIIFALYNYGSTPREEYLLLCFLRTALEKEILLKVHSLQDIITGNLFIIKMAIRFNRIGLGHNCLQELLEPLVNMVISDVTLHINTNPVDIYKMWISEIEMKSGKPSGHPYHVSPELALQHDEVKKRLDKAINSLKEITLIFCNAITQSIEKIPYGILYIAKTLKICLAKKFPNSTENELLKIIGNLIYYNYINSAITAPDAFDIIELEPGKYLTDKQRGNLGNIAKVLQFAATGKGFSQDSSHLMCLNLFIKDCHKKCKEFFHRVCSVMEPEDHFNMDRYSDAALLIQPTIYLTVQELCDIHQLLVKYKDNIIHNDIDPLQDILESLGVPPTVNSLLGEDDNDRSNTTSSTQLAQTEVCLTLSGKFQPTTKDNCNTDHLYVITKVMIVNLLKCLASRKTILEMVHIIPSPEEETYFMNKYQKNDYIALYQNHSMNLERYSSLADFQNDLLHNLNVLELEGYTSQKSGYQELLNSIAKDICNQHNFRQNRRKELLKLEHIKKQLELKTTFYEEKLDYYSQYIKTCLDNLHSGNKWGYKNMFHRSSKKCKSKVGLKYSGIRLHEKGVLVEVAELDHSQLKNLSFEIAPTDILGVFSIIAKFMGVALEAIEVDIQELLQLQYEGVAVVDMFGRAKVNVNLLLYLLNSKFYVKK